MPSGKKYQHPEPYAHEQYFADEPREVIPIYGERWMACGYGWAVTGNTREEAIENYHKANERHKEILARKDVHS